MTIKAVLIDHDGTLVESEDKHCLMWAEILKPHGITLTEDYFKKHYAGIPSTANAVEMVQRYRLTVSSEHLVSQKARATRAFLANAAFPLLPGALEAIQLFHRQGLKLAIVTGANREGLDSTIAGYVLEKYLSSSVAGDEVENNKPAPDCYLLAMEKLCISPDECYAIEDTEHGVNAATAAGIACLAVPNEMSLGQDFRAAVSVFGRISEASKWIINRL